MEGSSRREFIASSALIAAAAVGAPVAGWEQGSPRRRLRKLIDIGPGGVIDPRSAQDLRAAGNRAYFGETATGWIRLWADWPSLQPDADLAPDDALSPARWKLQALDEQIALAGALGLRVILMPYRFPRWANGTVDAPPDEGGKAPEYRLPEDSYGPGSAWAGFFSFVHDRYHAGRESGPRVTAFELVNEPNLQLWPQPGVAREIAQLLRTAQGISARHAHSTLLLAPSISDDDARTSERYTRWDEFVRALLDELALIGYLPHSGQAWSHHNYTDVERRRSATNSQAIRALLAGRWGGYAEGRAPTVFVTEGGARLSRMPELYPDEDPRQAQARCVRESWTRHLDEHGEGEGVAMLAQYLLYADPNFDCGLLDPYPSTEKRPAYAAWRAFPADG